MQTYIGYGFDTSTLPDTVWASLVQKYDAKDYLYLTKEATLHIEPSDDAEISIVESVLDYIDENCMSRPEYLANIINAEESKNAHTDYIVSVYDDFLVFDSVRFADDSARTKYIRTQNDFIEMIARYIPTTDITFGNVYTGVAWIDPSYYIE